MCNEPKFFICKQCGNLIGMIHNSGVNVVCCGDNMTELIPNTVDASVEKHVPVASVKGNTVSVIIGSAPHPMTVEHHIEWVYLLTQKGGQRICLEANAAPEASFILSADDNAVAVFAYCNLHGLWKSKFFASIFIKV